MVSGQELIELYKMIASKDSKGFTEVSLDLIKKEQDANHYRVSSTLTKLLEQIQDTNALDEQWHEEFSELPMDRDRTLSLISVSSPKNRLHQIILNEESSRKIDKILLEWRERVTLAQYGLQPIKRILFYGPPGCGKTFCASVIAGEMQVPLLTVKTDTLISSLLGETSINLRKIFDSLENKQAILFFDEFDSIAKSRMDFQEHGEVRRAVSNLLQFIENSPSNILLIAATNNPKLLDHAIWRRFDDVVSFSLPTNEEINKLVQLKMQNFEHNIDLAQIIPLFEGLSHAEIEKICYNSIKNAILMKKQFVDTSSIEVEINEYRSRKPINID